MPLIPNLSLYLIQKFDRLALWGNLTILELHFAETQVSDPLMLSFVTFVQMLLTSKLGVNIIKICKENLEWRCFYEKR